MTNKTIKTESNMKQNIQFNSRLAGRGSWLAAGTVAVALLTSHDVSAQTNGGSPQGPPEQTFFNSVAQYFSAFDTNSTTFATDTFDLWAGADTANNQNLAASLGLEILPFRIEHERVCFGAVRWGRSHETRRVAGTILSEQAGFGYNVTHFDTRLTGYVDTGYRFDTRQGYIAPGLRVKKALTENTYAGVGLELPVYYTHGAGQSTGAPSPTLSIFTGFKF